MSPAEVGVIIAAVTGLIVATPPVIKEIRAIRSGRAVAEKQRNRFAIDRVGELEDDLELERRYRFSLEENINKLRLLLVQLGFPEDKLPPWPTREKTHVN